MRPKIARARELRRNMSDPEILLWSRLRRLRERGFHIRRQYPFRGYYLDFACLSRRLAIEVDGYQHGDDRQAEHDAVRDRVLRRHGFRVLRFQSNDVRRNLDDVMERIVLALEAPPYPSGPREGGVGEAGADWIGAGQNAGSTLERGFPTRLACARHPPH